MKVLFVTDVGDTTGIGGHLYSVQSLVEALSRRIECVMVSLGSVTSPALAALACPQHRMAFARGKFRRAELARFMEIARREKPDVIHAFDPIACAFARVAARRLGCGLLVTKCGGPNPAARAYPWSYFPRVPRLVVFSEENEQYFKSRRGFRGMRIWRIPNRIGAVREDPAKVARLRARLDPAQAVLLRIGRISPSYGRTAEMSLRLVKRLVADGVPVQLVFLGAVQNEAAARSIVDRLGHHGKVISDPDLVAQASAVLDAGDLVVGTGRGLMEAAARGRILLLPARSGQLPALVDESNWQEFFDANFSERSRVAVWDEERNYANIRRALTDPDYRRQLSEFSRKLYEDQFALDRVLELYLSIYEEAREPERGRILDLARHWLWLLWRAQARPLAPLTGVKTGEGEAS